MFPIIVNDGQTPFPEDDIFYIVCKEGVYLKKRLGVMDSIAPVKNISILESIQTSATMHIKKIPATSAQQIINFFRAVYKEHFAEAIVLLFYNMEKKHHKIVCPHQEVSGGSADYTKGIIIEGYDMIGTIHSHARMSAFHSTIDDADEKTFDGLHITFGDMKDDDISISASIVANGHRVIVDPADYINQLVKTVDIDEEVKVPYAKTWKWDKDKHKMVEVQTTGRFYTRKQFDQRYKVQLSKDPKFPANWMERVEKKAWTPVTYRDTHGVYGLGDYIGESSYWKNWQGHNVGNKPGKNLPAKTEKADEKKVAPATVEVKKEQSPCDNCAFKNHKIGIALDQLDEDVKRQVIEWALDEVDQDANYIINESLGEDGDDLSHYECINCNSKFSVDDESEGDAACPICKTDDYLVEITATDLLIGDDDIDPTDEKIKDANLGMIHCKSCGSSFTKDFMVSGECPTCSTILDVGAKNQVERAKNYDSDLDEDIIQCPNCEKSFGKVKLIFDSQCPFCSREFDSFDVATDAISTVETNIETSRNDSGEYLDPDTEAIQKAIEADQNLERIPIPGQESVPINKAPRKPGLFAQLFQKRNRKR